METSFRLLQSGFKANFKKFYDDSVFVSASRKVKGKSLGIQQILETRVLQKMIVSHIEAFHDSIVLNLFKGEEKM